MFFTRSFARLSQLQKTPHDKPLIKNKSFWVPPFLKRRRFLKHPENLHRKRLYHWTGDFTIRLLKQSLNAGNNRIIPFTDTTLYTLMPDNTRQPESQISHPAHWSRRESCVSSIP
ncbi:hypothetical protein GOB93_10545 [Acetobacter musti]|uniref:Transposase n=1 Tax=Acetobacter musti TaxID=864732 RepID=A0ABX0JNT2_9PROT|nr:hypothetical protein [Acetobacter musti]NHN85076.1 hypothetical protein [Acetobacter musti]